ncbi:hypothetical protein PL81_33765, partial [Streptomyces sp. RSD-27]
MFETMEIGNTANTGNTADGGNIGSAGNIGKAGPAAALRRARGATTACFALNGFVMGMWIVHIPAVERRTGVGHALLGWLLLLLGAG